MVKQKVPDLAFGEFVLGELSDLFDNNKIKINEEYQRGDIWKPKQRIDLIKSIENKYSIGVLVLFVNEKGQYEILDGQQRLLTIKKYLEDSPEVEDDDIKKYLSLSKKEKIFMDSYCIYYLKIKSFDEESKEEDIVQTFLRLQEGSPLNKAEKINAHRGKFKDTFREIREKHILFSFLEPDKRFRLRQLSAELLLLELEGDINKKDFPSLSIDSLVKNLERYKDKISQKKVKRMKETWIFCTIA